MELQPYIPHIPDINGRAVTDDPQLRQILIAMKITLEKLTDTTDELTAALAALTARVVALETP